MFAPLIEIARDNARINNIDNVEFVVSDLFDNVEDQFDIIISNPPYIPSVDIDSLEKEVRDYDPILALDGGIDGLYFYKRIIMNSPKYLKENGVMYLEFGINQAQDIVNMLEPEFEDIQVFKDYSGVERYIKARKRNNA